MRRLRTFLLFVALTVVGVAASARTHPSPRRALGTASHAAEQSTHAGGGDAKHWACKIVALLTVLAVGGFLMAVSGIIPLKASSGHWPITTWLLELAKHRSVATHTLGLNAPALDAPQLVLKGAGHYETGCSPCHGSPELRHPRMVQQMLPPPPYLPPRLSAWEPAELFYIVKHGIKFTGMPAWPARQRDDEVWAMVAFLRALPTLDAAAYRRLVYGDAVPHETVVPLHGLLAPGKVPTAVTASCARCHGVDGRGRGIGAFPKLAGQRALYLLASLEAFARGERHSGMMEPIAAGLSFEAMREVARYYASLPEPWPSPPPQDAMLAFERGQAIASRGIPRQRVPACVACHGPGATHRNPVYPALAGQYADYLVLQLELFQKAHRGGSSYAHLMRVIAARLTAEQMRDVALYYASLPNIRTPPVQ